MVLFDFDDEVFVGFVVCGCCFDEDVGFIWGELGVFYYLEFYWGIGRVEVFFYEVFY